MSAAEESIRLWRRALAVLAAVPAGRERDAVELELHFALSTQLIAVRGWSSPEVEAELVAVRALAERLHRPDLVAQSLTGLSAMAFVRSDLRAALDLGHAALRLEGNEPGHLAENHLMLGGTLVSLGDLEGGQRHLGRVQRWAARQVARPSIIGADPFVFAAAWRAHALWLRGFPQQALDCSEEASSRALALGHPFSLVVAYSYGALTRQFRGDAAGTREQAKAALELCERYGFRYYGQWGTILLGWAEAAQGEPTAATTTIESGLAGMRAHGANARRPYYLALLAEAHMLAGSDGRARSVLGAALATANRYRDVWWNAEILRLTGVSTPDHRAERYLLLSRSVARQQGSHSLELRAAVSLAHHWRAHDRAEAAESCVARALAWFGEGFDTPDLRAAAALLEARASAA